MPAIESTLSELATKTPLLSEGGQGSALDKAVVTYTTPWIVSHTKQVLRKDEKGFVFDNKALRNIQEDEKKTFKSELKAIPDDQSEIFESGILDLYLNGYSAPAPIREKVFEAEVGVVLSAAPKNFLWTVENMLIKSVGLKKGVAMHSFLYVFYKVLSHSFQNLHYALLLNMTERSTDALFLKHGGKTVNASVAFGPATIGQAVADHLMVPLEIAYSYLRLFADGNLDDKTTEQIDKVLVEKEDVWKELWRRLRESVAVEGDLPYSIFLIVPLGFGRVAKTFLESVFPKKNIILIGDTNTFTKELVQGSESSDESILLISSFSNLLN